VYFTIALTIACDHGVRCSEMPWKLKSSTPSAARKTNCTSARVEELGPSLTAMESDTIVPPCATGLLTRPPGGKSPNSLCRGLRLHNRCVTRMGHDLDPNREITHDQAVPHPPPSPAADHPRAARRRPRRLRLRGLHPRCRPDRGGRRHAGGARGDSRPPGAAAANL